VSDVSSAEDRLEKITFPVDLGGGKRGNCFPSWPPFAPIDPISGPTRIDRGTINDYMRMSNRMMKMSGREQWNNACERKNNTLIIMLHRASEGGNNHQLRAPDSVVSELSRGMNIGRTSFTYRRTNSGKQ